MEMEVDASLTELQASIVKREARECNGKGCKRKKKKNGAKKKEGAKKKGAARRKSPRKNQKGKNKEKKSPGKKSKSERRRQRQRKTKTGKNKNKKKKNKVDQEKEKIEGRNNGNGGGRQITGNATSCAMKAIKYARLFEGKATSIFRQVKRVKGNDKIQGSKGKKKGDFNATMDRLVAALGGDIDNPKCDGTPIKDSNGSSSANATFRNGTTAK